MDFVVQAAIFISVLQAGAAIKCYECDSQIQVQCSGEYSPRKSFLKDSGNDPGDACYELSTRDPNGTIFFQRGIISRFKEDKYTRLCLGGEEIYPRIGDDVRRNNVSSPKRRNASSPAEDAFHKLQVLASHRNPAQVLKGGDEEEETTRVEPNYNCTTCVKDRCNWKVVSDYSDLQENTDDEEEDFEWTTEPVPNNYTFYETERRLFQALFTPGRVSTHCSTCSMPKLS